MKIAIVGPCEGEYHDILSNLVSQGHDVYTPAFDLRLAIGLVAAADAVILTDDWWTDTNANCLSYVAAWLRLPHLDVAGEPIQMVKRG